MKERDDLLYLRHMLDAIGRIESYLGGVDEGSFLANSEKQDAVVRQLQILGEAVKRLSVAVRAAHPNIPWRGCGTSWCTTISASIYSLCG